MTATPRPVLGFVSASVLRSPIEMADLLPPGVDLVATGLNVFGHTGEELDRIDTVLPRAAEALARDGAAGILVNAVPHAVRRGRDAEQELYDGIADALGVPVVSGAASMADALVGGGCRRPLLVTAYRDEVNVALARYLAAWGLHVAGAVGLAATGPAQSARLGVDSFVAAARDLAEGSEADGVLLGVRVGADATATAIEAATSLGVVTGLGSGTRELLRRAGPPGLAFRSREEVLR